MPSSPFVSIKIKMISHGMFKLFEREKVHSILFAEFLLYGLVSALLSFSRSVLSLSLFVVAGWIWNSRQHMPEGTRSLPGPWGEFLSLLLTR